MIDIDRKILREACRLYGSISAIAKRADVDYGNFNKWLRGEPTMSDEKVGLVLQALSIPQNNIKPKRVQAWTLKAIPECFMEILNLYFPKEFEIYAVTPSIPAYFNQHDHERDAFASNDINECIYFFTDNNFRSILRIPMILQLENRIEEFVGKHKRRIKFQSKDTDINELKSWRNGIPSIGQFDHIINNEGLPPEDSLESVSNVIHEEGISFEEAIRRIRGAK